MPFSQELYARALEFAALAHGAQQTPKGQPYVVHLAQVCMEATRALDQDRSRDADLLVACALLHDTLEDTATREEQLEREFGAKVAAGVRALTKNDALPKEERMPDSLRRILAQPGEVAMVKLADRITNLAPPPAHWTREKVSAYRREGEEILAALGHASGFLAARFRERLAQYPR